MVRKKERGREGEREGVREGREEEVYRYYTYPTEFYLVGKNVEVYLP